MSSGKHSPYTYELRVAFHDPKTDQAVRTKAQIKDWLTLRGVESFVDGAVDNLDLDYEHGMDVDPWLSDLENTAIPISIYKYDRDFLRALREELEKRFPKSIECS